MFWRCAILATHALTMITPILTCCPCPLPFPYLLFPLMVSVCRLSSLQIRRMRVDEFPDP
jgi:integral membrane sensor domain MASE1